MTLLASVLVLAFALPALRQALDSDAAWTMERRLPGSSRTFESRGLVRCRAGRGIVWSVQEPFVSSVEMSTNAMVFADEGVRRVKSLDELPHYAGIRKATDAFAAGDAKAFDGVFKIEETALSDGGWRLVLTPEVSAMKRLFTSIELTGAELPTNAVLRTDGGGSSVIRFKEIPRVP